MKRKNILLIVFMLTLFVFQQVQAEGTIPFTENNSGMNAPLATGTGWADVVFIKIYPLNLGTGQKSSETPCTWATYQDGCGSSEPVFTGTVTGDEAQGYSVDCNNKPQNPYSRRVDVNDPQSAHYLCIDGDYLPDVLPIEMNIGQIHPPEPEALKALAVAARTFVKYKKYWPWGSGSDETAGWPPINNSSEYQVYVPGSRSGDYKDIIETNVNLTSGQYLSYNGNVIDAEYSSEIIGKSNPNNNSGQDYLASVEEPISSTACTLSSGNNGNLWGISQRGAIRWAKGNTCPDGSGTTWPISGMTSPMKWDYKQILVHYYTEVDIVGANIPGDRWNLLWHNNFNNVTLTGGQPASLQIQLQNTSTTSWSANTIEVGYHWGDNNWQTASVSPSFPGIPPGKEFPESSTPQTYLTVSNIIPPSTSGAYTLHLDLRRNGGAWFSSGGWPDATINVNVTGSIATPTIPPTPTITPTPIIGALVCDTVAPGVTCTDYGTYLDYNINIVVTGLTGGATALDTSIGTYKRLFKTNAGYMGFSSDFIHCETSGEPANTVFSAVGINTFDAGGFLLNPTFTNGPGTNICVHNEVLNDWRLVGGTDGWPNFVSVKGNVDWIITGYSIVGHIYISSNQNLTLLTSTPTPAPSPTTAPSEPCDCPVESLNFWPFQNLYCWIFGSNTLKLAVPIGAVQSTQQAVLDVQLFHRVEDEILSQTTQGQHYIDLYYANGNEIIQILYNSPALRQEAIEVLQMWEPNLQALVDGEGNTVTITNTQVQAVQTFLNNLSSQASPELQQVIANEQIQQPLEQFVGVTMNEALVYVEDGLSETPTPTQTPTATPTVTPTVTPAPITVSLQPNGANGIDTYILSSSSNANYGTSADMGIGENSNFTNKFARSLLKFDVSSIPSNAIITSATLSLWTSNDFAINPGTIEIYRLKVPFNESQATWNRSATGVNWQVAGASGINDREATAMGSVQIIENETLNIEKQVILDPTRVQEWINGVFTNNGMILVMSTELDNRFDFKTSDTSTTTQRPKLVITYILQP